ncbi:two-component system histidine kinase PnpS [Pontibacillus litoralis]|uniref:histidine kinase n=1 Tax=Pontibacillus litoralis JSM 072002 TaxID=1385512 RepID=A0A0A5GD14_9BACI|nr:HAMP domain-containing sensor histidine kinase [Pontibacillus litoralis]KGX89088.1 alkaline phosphatase [Pontibacillus litoralis JSM 072002]
MRKQVSRPFLSYSILAIILMMGLGIVLAQLTKNFIVDIIEERVKNDAHYLVDLLDNADGVSQLEHISDKLNIALVYKQDADVVFDTTDDVLDLSEKERESVQQFVQSYDLSLSPMNKGQLKNNIFYFPFQINDNDELSGTIFMIIKVNAVTDITKHIWLIIGITVFIGILVMATLGRSIFEKYIKPIRSAARVADELAQGNYRARTYEGNFGEAAQLTSSINVLARNLQEMSMVQEMQNDRLEAVINNMGNGLVLIDEKGYVNLVNKAFLDSFKGEYNDYLGHLYYQAIQEEEVHKAVKEVFMTEQHVRHSFTRRLQIERRFLEVLGAPIINESYEWKGVVLVFHDITELKNLEQTRKDFVANVSHELRTPITSIRGFSETLLDGAMQDEALREQFINIILKESQRLQSLIHDLLELSKLEKEEFQLNIEPISIRAMINDIIPIVEQQADEKEITIHTHFEEDVLMEGDAARLKQVVMNLLGNAIHYSHPRGSVTVSIKKHQADVHIMVEDNGVGIPEEEVPRIFERFYRVDKARSRNSGGTGLGLAIVKHIVEAHHGTIKVDSVYEKGTTFHIFIPMKFTLN